MKFFLKTYLITNKNSTFMQKIKYLIILAVMIISANSFGQAGSLQIIGVNNDCENTATYTIANPNPSYVYTWSLSSGGSIISGQGTSSIVIAYNHTFSQTGPCNYAILNVVTNDIYTGTLKIYPCCNISTTYRFNNYSTSAPLTLSNCTVIINGDFIANHNVSFSNATVHVSPNSKIKLMNSGVTLSVIGSLISSNIDCCTDMWDGIYTNSLSQQVTIQNSTITNAQKALYLFGGTPFTIENSVFQDNFRNISIYQGSGGGTPPYSGIIRNTSFIGNTSLPYPPYQGVQTYSGIEVFRTYDLTLGDPSSANYANNFENMFCGIKTEQSLVKIYNNKFTNINSTLQSPGSDPTQIYNATAIFSIGDPAYSPMGNHWHASIIGGNGLYSNNIKFSYNGIYGFNVRLDVDNNIVNTTNFGVEGKDLFDNSYVGNNNIAGAASAADHARTGISIANIQPRECKIRLFSNVINAKNRGIMITNANSNIASNLLVQIYSNTILLDGTNPPVNKPNSAIKVGNCFGINIYNNSMSIANWAIPTSANLFYGIDIAQTTNALITNNPFIDKYGAGINVFGNCNLTQFFCNKIYDGYYGFLFNTQSTITSQGYAYPAANIPTDNEWFGNWNLGPTTRRLWADPAHLLSSNTRWYVRSNPPFSYQLLNPPNNPTNGFLVQANTTNTLSPCASLPQPNTAIGISAGEREELYGKIVRDSNTYTQLEEQYKAYDKEILYKALKENPAMINLNDASDALYQNFYTEEAAGNIEKIAEIEALIKDNQDSLAMLKNAELQDQKQIDYFRKLVNEIYLTTFARGNYNLTQEQTEILKPIAVLYTPWEGGDAVYIARLMLNLDDEAIEADFAKAPPKQFTDIAQSNAKLYPNPAKDEVMIEFENGITTNAVLEIYGYAGNLLQSNMLNSGSQYISVSIKDLKAGLYFYKITSDNEVVCKNKLLIIK